MKKPQEIPSPPKTHPANGLALATTTFSSVGHQPQPFVPKGMNERIYRIDGHRRGDGSRTGYADGREN